MCPAEVVGDEHTVQLNSAATLKAREHVPGGAIFPQGAHPSPTPWGHSWRLTWVFRLQIPLSLACGKSLALSGQKQAPTEGEGRCFGKDLGQAFVGGREGGKAKGFGTNVQDLTQDGAGRGALP